MNSRRHRIRFSIGAMLVLMTVAALLVDREVQRAKAIDATKKRTQEWRGHLSFKARAYMPRILKNVLPESYTQEIDEISLAILTMDGPRTSDRLDRFDRYAVISDRNELDDMLELGSLDNLTTAVLRGNAIHYSVVSRICKSTSLKRCFLFNVALSYDEILKLRNDYPNIIFVHNISNEGR